MRAAEGRDDDLAGMVAGLTRLVVVGIAVEGRDDDLAGMVAGLTRLVVVGIAVVVLLFATLGFLVS